MPTDSGGAHNAHGQGFEIVVTRVPPPPTIMRVRFTGHLDGLFTHFVRYNQPCNGDGCKFCTSHTPRQWRGYIAAEVLDTVRRLWIPTVVEITSRLYYDLEGTVLRGTVWDLYRLSRNKNRDYCTGNLIDEVDPQKLPRPVDVVAAVKRLYRNLPLQWGKTPELGSPQVMPGSVWLEAPPVAEATDVPPPDLESVLPRRPGESTANYTVRYAAFKQATKGGGEG